MIQYGVGDALARLVGGNAPTTQAGPSRFSGVQDISLDVSQKLEKLMGQNKWPDDIAPGDMEGKGKATFSRFNISLFNSLFFADTITTGTKVMTIDEPASVPAVSTYVVSVTGAANFVNDLSVKDATTGVNLIQVAAGAEAAGAYSVAETGVNKGKYTFAAADANRALLFTYVQKNTVSGQTLTVVNHKAGYGPIFELYLRQPYQGENGLHLFACRCSKVSFPQKRGGYMISDFEFEIFANPAGSVLEMFEANPGA